MKKNILKFAAIAMIAGFLTSCDEDVVRYNGGDFVMFNNASSSTVSVSESAGTLELPITLSKALGSDLTLNLVVTDGTAIAGEHYSVASNTVVIPAGATTAVFPITIIDDEDFNLSRTLSVSIESTSIPGFVIGLSGQEATSTKIVSIANDDCPTKYYNWFGNLSITDVGYPAVGGTGSANAAGDCDVLVVVGDIAGGGIVSTTNFFLTPDSEGATFGTVDVPRQVYCTNCSGGMDAFYTASGTYDEETNVILVDYTLVRTDGASFWDGQTEIVPAN